MFVPFWRHGSKVFSRRLTRLKPEHPIYSLKRILLTMLGGCCCLTGFSALLVGVIFGSVALFLMPGVIFLLLGIIAFFFSRK